MRTKALSGLAVLAASAVTCVAQNNVYSLNIVGYVNKTVEANKYYLLENPLTKGATADANNVTNVILLNDTFDQSVIYTYENSILAPKETYFAGFGWAPGETVLTPGTAFYLFSKAAGTVTFVGEVTLGSTNSLSPGFNMVGSPYPASMSLTGLGLVGQNTDRSDIVYRYKSATGTFNLITYFNGYGWVDGENPEGSVEGPNLDVGEGIWYYNANPAALEWKQSFTVGP